VSEDDPEEVAGQGGVEPHQSVAADKRDRDHDEDADEAPGHSPTIKCSTVAGRLHAP
jgi:hypothetical protein